jgi:cell division protein ZapE
VLQAFATTTRRSRSGCSGAAGRRRAVRASTSTAATASARPTCSRALWHDSAEPRAYGTFVELTHLVGALGFGPAVEALSGHRLLAIDEFELDDPGDTVLVSTLLQRLVDAGVRVAATSNTLPDALGEGALRGPGLPARDPRPRGPLRAGAGRR